MGMSGNDNMNIVVVTEYTTVLPSATAVATMPTAYTVSSFTSIPSSSKIASMMTTLTGSATATPLMKASAMPKDAPPIPSRDNTVMEMALTGIIFATVLYILVILFGILLWWRGKCHNCGKWQTKLRELKNGTLPLVRYHNGKHGLSPIVPQNPEGQEPEQGLGQPGPSGPQPTLQAHRYSKFPACAAPQMSRPANPLHDKDEDDSLRRNTVRNNTMSQLTGQTLPPDPEGQGYIQGWRPPVQQDDSSSVSSASSVSSELNKNTTDNDSDISSLHSRNENGEYRPAAWRALPTAAAIHTTSRVDVLPTGEAVKPAEQADDVPSWRKEVKRRTGGYGDFGPTPEEAQARWKKRRTGGYGGFGVDPDAYVDGVTEPPQAHTGGKGKEKARSQ